MGLFPTNKKELRQGLKRSVETAIEGVTGGDWLPGGTLTLEYDYVEGIMEQVAEWADEWIFSLMNKSNQKALELKLTNIREELDKVLGDDKHD